MNESLFTVNISADRNIAAWYKNERCFNCEPPVRTEKGLLVRLCRRVATAFGRRGHGSPKRELACVEAYKH